MDILKIIEEIPKFVTIPLLIFLGIIVTYIWRQLEKLYKAQTNLREKERDLEETRLKFILSKIEPASELKAQVDIIREATEVKVQSLKKEKDELSGKLSIAETNKVLYLEQINKLEKQIDEVKINQDKFYRSLINAINPLQTILLSIKFINKLISGDKINDAKQEIERLSKDVLLVSSTFEIIREYLFRDYIKREDSILYEKIKIDHIVKSAVGLFSVVAKKMKLDIKYSSLELPAMFLNKKDIELAFLNLISNSIVYSKVEGKDIVIKFREMNNSNSFEWVIIDIVNWGIGVLEQEKDLIFTPFYRGSNAQNCYPDGFGIGLSNARRILEDHNGKLVLTSLHDPTIFSVYLPRSLIENKPHTKHDLA